MNRVFLSVFIAGIAAQSTKMVIFWLRGNFVSWKDLFVTGNMPSSHSALVSALALSILLSQGPTTTFLISFVLASIVIRDSLGVRRSVGDEGQAINKIIKKSRLKIPPVHYSLGHKPREVVAGIAIGILSAFLIFLM